MGAQTLTQLAADDFSLSPYFRETSVHCESLMGSSCCPNGHHTNHSITDIPSRWWSTQETAMRGKEKEKNDPSAG